MEAYLRSAGADNPQLPESLKEAVGGYLDHGFTWFVFDVVELSEPIESTEDIQYHFATKSLFYPLKISGSMQGDSKVKLLVLTPDRILLRNDVGVAWTKKPFALVVVTVYEAERIDRDMSVLFRRANRWSSGYGSFREDFPPSRRI